MTDAELLAKYRDPSSRNYAFNLLVRQYQQKVYWHIRKMVIDHDDADDLVQETFIKVWNSLEQFRGDSQLYTWIYRIATNECLNFLNKKRRRFFLPIGDVEGELMEKLESNADFVTSGNEPSGEEIQMKLQKALLKLPDKQRLVFNMKYFDDMKYEDIAEITGTSVGALKASYHLAVKKIEDYLDKSDTSD
ncbi:MULTISPECIES: RNA polymerase sigma factor [Spirosoma]|uniref:RNA polymerase sigma factor n=1 Tax=Spirosoma liriopis TaxID=2937440 RepID=A0ABT0HPW4_9BACT|nr:MULTISPECIES: sigma-70 family RNA polymerase sigma factor [Spirosoma]MCK8494207.1 sigma-70 family RNA polymerase sigma factor [Spirosoma liriopis]UHG89219.1 sigma-70 family RNA polymerase sigma factor [Spirosoma oryzicola]